MTDQAPTDSPIPISRKGRSRREFLAATTLAAGSAAVLSRSAGAGTINFGFDGSVPKAQPRVPLAHGETIRIGVIGPGGMGRGHIGAFINAINKKGRENVQVVAVADVCSVRVTDAQAAIKKDQGTEADGYSDYRDILKRDDIHGVLCAAPEHWHGQIARDAIIAGKDVYCEKPMTLRLDDALKLREYQRANPEAIVQIGTQKMMLPKYNEAQRLIAEGAIGHPTFSQTSYCRNSKDGEWLYYAIDDRIKPGETIDWRAWCGPLGPQPWNHDAYHRWRRYRTYSTGIIGDLLVHQVTPMMMALQVGYPTRVVGTGGHYIDKAMENHDQVNLQIQFGPKDHTMIVAGSTCNEIGLEVMIRGHKATMYLNSRDVVIRPERIYAEDVEPQTVECPDIGNDQDALRVNWLECIRSREEPKSPVEFATQVMVAVDLSTRSMWEGKAYEFDPETMTARAI